MKNYLNAIRRCPLFAGVSEENLNALLDCLNANVLSANKGDTILNVGDRPDHIGLVLEGYVHIVQEDYWGNRTIVTDVKAGGLFGEAFSCAEAAALPVSIIAREPVKFLLIDCKKMSTTCATSCNFHAHLIHNLMKILANNNIALTHKMKHITKKTTREKVLSYLSECAIAEGSNSFTITFNRQELADYLSVERSALSNTLCKMRDNGEIEFEKNKFTLN